MNMKYSKLYIIPVLVASLASCTKVQGPDGGVPQEGRAVSISASVDAAGASGTEAMVSKTKGAGSPATRAEGSTPYSGSTLGLFLDYGTEPIEGNANVLWKNDGSNSWTTAGQMRWGKASDNVGVYAYAPYLEGQTDASAVKFTIPTDQSEGLGAADLLWWYKGIEDGKKADVTAKDFEDGRIDIAFRHALIKLTVNFDLASQFDGKNISIKEAWFHRSSNKVEIDFSGLSNNNVPYVKWGYGEPDYTVCSIKMHNCSTEKELSCEILFFPCSLKKDSKLLTVTLSDGRDYILALDKDLDLKKNESGNYVVGTAYEMTVTVGKDKLEMGTITVAPWINKDNLGQKKHYTDATEYSEWGGPADIAKRYAGGDGTKNNPYEIATAAQLAFLAQETNKGAYKGKLPYFKLTGNIDLMGHEWTPIGIGPDDNNKFEGIFDGGNHTILNLKVSNAQYAGLFGYIQPWGVQDTVTVKNLRLREAVIVSKSSGNSQVYAGIMAGSCRFRSNIQNCYVEGSVTGDSYAGGIVGSLEGKISGCTAVVKCTTEDNDAKHAWCGGIAGESYGTIDNCTVRGEVKGSETAGGAVGILRGSGELNLCYSFADVILDKVFSPSAKVRCNVGGLVGESEDGLPSAIKKIEASLAGGKVSVASGLDIRDGEINVGGFIGRAIYLEISKSKFNGIIEAGKPANGTLNAGGFIGYLDTKVTATYCLYDKDGIGGFPIVGAKASGADDSGLEIIEDQY